MAAARGMRAWGVLLALALCLSVQRAVGHARVARSSALHPAWMPRRLPRVVASPLAMSSPSASFLDRFGAAAREMAADGGCEVSEVAWRAPVLCVEVGRETSSEQLQELNVALSEWLDAQEAAGAADVPTGEFELEVGTPGVREELTQVGERGRVLCVRA